MCLQPLVRQSPHLLLQGCNLVANWLEDGGKNWKLKLEMVIINTVGVVKSLKRSGDMTGASRLERSDQWCVGGLSGSAHYRHTQTCTSEPCRAITGVRRADYLAILSCTAILPCSWKFTLCPCVFPLSLSLFLPFFPPFVSLVTFLDRPIFQAPDIGDYK